MNENLKPTKIIIFYDDNCVLCSHSIQFLIKRDIQKQFLFSPLQGKLAKRLIDPNYIKKLENKFASYLNCKYAIATSSCTGAMHIALMSLNKKRWWSNCTQYHLGCYC